MIWLFLIMLTWLMVSLLVARIAYRVADHLSHRLYTKDHRFERDHHYARIFNRRGH